MRSARMLLATAAATAVLTITAPGAYAEGDQRDREDHGYSKEHDKDQRDREDHGYGKEHDKDQRDREDHGYGKEHDKGSRHDGPRGGVHTGGGALAAVNDEEQWNSERAGKQEPDASKEREHGKESWEGGHDKGSWKDEHDKGSWKGDHDKPRGGVHTGGGALDTPPVTAGGLAVLAVAGTGLYVLRRRKTAGSAA
ncbi:transmembrane domain-containing protein [Streptomyces sp. TG1A-60]|uniref:EGFR-like transmembrane domain-containing protein n=1 Tax=Streptomyces sp. TG1A-60 TaxID=3129111 RepID=UPI0030D3242A